MTSQRRSDRPSHDRQLNIRVTAKEYQMFDEAAQTMGLSLSAWIRVAARKALSRGAQKAGSIAT